MSGRRAAAAAGATQPAATRVVVAAAWALGTLLPAALAGVADGAAPAAGDGPGSPRDCAAIADPAQRLACFDRFYPKGAPAPLPIPAQATTGTATAPASVPTAAPGYGRDAVPAAMPAAGSTAAVPNTSDAEALFGLNAEVRRARGETPPAERQAPQQIESSLASLASLGPGRLRLTLANGQVWDQVEAAPGFQPQIGDPITVRQAAMGSYLLRGRVGAPIRARRVR